MFGSCFAALLRRFMFGVRPICAFCRRACPRFTLGDAVLLRRFALGSRPVYGSIVAFCVRSRLLFAACAPNRTACGMLRFYSAGSRSPFVRSRDVGAVIGRGGNAELVCAAMRFLSPRLPSVYARRCGSVAALCTRFTSGIRFYCGVLRSITPAVCRLCAKQDGLRDVAFLFRRVEIAIRTFS